MIQSRVEVLEEDDDTGSLELDEEIDDLQSQSKYLSIILILNTRVYCYQFLL